MKGIVQIYRALFSSRLFPLHFQYINGCFVRVHGEIIQSLQLQRFSCVKQCTIVFALIPLRQKIDYFDVGLYNLRDFTIPPTLQQADSWTYDASEASKTACIQEMLALVEKDLIPLFEKCSECKETLSALLDLEMRFYQNACAARRLWGKECWIPALGNGINLYDGRKYCMALKAEDYSMASRIVQAYLETHLHSLHCTEPKQPEHVLRKLEKAIQYEQAELSYIAARNTTYFSELLAENERYTRKILEQSGVHLEQV